MKFSYGTYLKYDRPKTELTRGEVKIVENRHVNVGGDWDDDEIGQTQNHVLSPVKINLRRST